MSSIVGASLLQGTDVKTPDVAKRSLIASGISFSVCTGSCDQESYDNTHDMVAVNTKTDALLHRSALCGQYT